MTRVRLATTWLDGCSGCHMSLLDMDDRLIELAAQAVVVYGPYVDVKEFPEAVDVTLVEGAVSSQDDLQKIRTIRARTKLLVSMGDCGVTGNVPAMRNSVGADEILNAVYANGDDQPHPPSRHVPRLLPHSRPIHEIVKVDVFIPGCPPSADTIHYALSELLAGRVPDLSGRTRFGA
jgi:NAD-reducing hydrogenase small subunit